MKGFTVLVVLVLVGLAAAFTGRGLNKILQPQGPYQLPHWTPDSQSQQRSLERTFQDYAAQQLSMKRIAAQQASFDYVVMGGGTAGTTDPAVLAQASDRPSVLVIEEGPDASARMNNIVGFWGTGIYPPTLQNLQDFALNFLYMRDTYSFEGAYLGFRNLFVAAGLCLGGGATINGNLASRPPADNLAAFGSALWTFNATNADWNRFIADGSCAGEYFCNTAAPIFTYPYPPDSLLSAARNALAAAFGMAFNPNIQGPSAAGIGTGRRNIAVNQTTFQPIRQEPWSRILQPLLASLPKVTVLTGAKVVSIDIRSNGKHRVNYVIGSNCFSVEARREVHFAMGPIHNAHIAMLSGIGDCPYLATVGVGCMVNNSDVGKHLHVNTLAGGIYASTTGLPPDFFAGIGSIISGTYRDPSTGLPMEVSSTSLTAGGNTYFVLHEETQLGGSVAGTVRLTDLSAFTKPYVQTNLYSVATDVIALAYQMMTIRNAMLSIPTSFNASIPQFFELEPGFVAVPPGSPLSVYVGYLLSGGAAAGHHMGSMNMHLVVNERCQLIDGNGVVIPGIRVVDGSITPTQLTVLTTHSSMTEAILTGAVCGRFAVEDWAH